MDGVVKILYPLLFFCVCPSWPAFVFLRLQIQDHYKSGMMTGLLQYNSQDAMKFHPKYYYWQHQSSAVYDPLDPNPNNTESMRIVLRCGIV